MRHASKEKIGGIIRIKVEEILSMPEHASEIEALLSKGGRKSYNAVQKRLGNHIVKHIKNDLLRELKEIKREEKKLSETKSIAIAKLSLPFGLLSLGPLALLVEALSNLQVHGLLIYDVAGIAASGTVFLITMAKTRPVSQYGIITELTVSLKGVKAKISQVEQRWQKDIESQAVINGIIQKDKEILDRIINAARRKLERE
ncbi:MAG: hypothetical protein KGH61_00950 [Candidatus Micrarchaeota archaeon]|nr:hypothetical protein [Candidatus Micrarchaeota archaeon]MDE1847502.1 hypothetical protein [Candidatus Micrarchaeota archaeon]MDE1863862.1 hypothetical protein [Candidatus Micrarchaeota archaeon]